VAAHPVVEDLDPVEDVEADLVVGPPDGAVDDPVSKLAKKDSAMALS
jgi:hypothetical protein